MITRIKSLMGGSDLNARLSRSTLFSILGFGAENALRLGGNLILTRILFPEAFGLMALVMVVMGGLAMFSDLGLRPSIIQNERGSDPAFLNTAWTIQIIRGVLLFIVTWAVATPVAAFYGDPRLAEMLPFAALIPLITGFASTRLATVNRDLQIGRLTMLTVGTQTAGLIVTILLALWLKSVWALVLGTLVPPLLQAVLSHIILPGNRDRLQFEWAAARQMLGFGAYIFLATIAGFLVNQGDRAILGKFVSLEELALYNIAFFLATVPILLTRKLTEVVIFPLYARNPPAESLENRQNVIKARWAITGLAMMIAFSFAVVGNWLVVLLYDARYEAAGPIMVLIAVAHLPAIITASYDHLALAAGDSRRFAIMVICMAIIRVAILLVATINFGVVGAALAALPAVLLHYPILISLTRRYKGWAVSHDVTYLGLSAVIAAVVVWVNWDALSVAFANAGPQ